MSYTDKITCPHCNKDVELEVNPSFDEPDDIEIKPIVERRNDKEEPQPNSTITTN